MDRLDTHASRDAVPIRDVLLTVRMDRLDTHASRDAVPIRDFARAVNMHPIAAAARSRPLMWLPGSLLAAWKLVKTS